jgi:hypothetical protein
MPGCAWKVQLCRKANRAIQRQYQNRLFPIQCNLATAETLPFAHATAIFSFGNKKAVNPDGHTASKILTEKPIKWLTVKI